jgi:hypothetical protein
MLYHYTSIKNIKKILDKKQFRLTRIADFNDNSEFKHTISMCCDKLLLSDNDRNFIIGAMTKKQNLIFVGCFCSNCDSLFLWKNYGKFNIEFYKSGLVELADQHRRSYGDINSISGFINCEYLKESQELVIESALEQWKRSNGCEIPIDTLSHLSTIFKQQKFFSERETRISVCLNSVKQVKTNFSKIKRRYLPLHFQSNLNDLIKSITIGPSICPENEERKLKLFLKKHDIRNITIRHSEISYDDFLHNL